MFFIFPARCICSFILLFFLILVWGFSSDRVEAQLRFFGQGNRQHSEQDTKRAKQEFATEFPLTVTDGLIGFEFPADFNEASSIVGQIAGGSGSSSSQGGDGFACSARNNSVEVEVSKNMRNQVIGPQVEPCKSVSIKGAGSTYWRTQLFRTEEQFLCSHVDFSAKTMFQLIGNAAGVQVVLFEGPEMVSLKGKNYFDLASQPEFQQIIDRAEQWGIKMPSKVSPSMLDEMILAVLMVSTDEWADFEKDFSDLAAGTFKEREEATERLKRELNQWKHLVAWGLTSSEVSLELKSRLMAVVKDNQTDEAAKQIVGLTSAKLMDNREKLVDLLSNPAAADEKVLSAIVQRLQQLTDKDFGTDIAAWQKWSDETQQASATPPSAKHLPQQNKLESELAEPADKADKPNDPQVTNRVTIELVREEVSRLLALDIDDQDQIRLDRDRWAKPFGERNIPSLLKETQKQFKESGLPESWLNLGGGYDLKTIDYPQLLFAQLDESLTMQSRSNLALRQMRMQMQMNMHRMNNQNGLMLNNSLNREIQNGEISFRLELHPETELGRQAENPQAKFFKFSYLDDVQNSNFILDEQPDGDFNLLICNIETNEFVGIGQNAQRSWIHVCTNSGSFSASDESPRELFQAHAEQWRLLLHPVLQHHGIDLTESAGGTLKIKNAVLKQAKQRRGIN